MAGKQVRMPRQPQEEKGRLGRVAWTEGPVVSSEELRELWSGAVRQGKEVTRNQGPSLSVLGKVQSR